MSRLGVLRNPDSRLNRRRPAPAPPDALVIEPEAPRAIPIALRAFRDAGVDLLAVDGGDGTVREVVTALPSVWPRDPPRLGLLASGRTNVIARDVGVRGPRRSALARLDTLNRLQMLRATHRRPLILRWSDGNSVRGFCFGAAAYRRATELALSRGARGAEGAAAVGLTAAAALVQALASPQSAWMAGEPMTLAIDDEPATEAPRFLLFATTLRRLPLANGLATREPDTIAVLDAPAPPPRLARAASALLRGSPTPWLAQAGYRRAHATTLKLVLSEPCVLDGETFPGGALEIHLGEPLTFVTP